MNRFYTLAPGALLFLIVSLSAPCAAQTPAGIINQVIGSTGKSVIKQNRYWAYTVGEVVIPTFKTGDAGYILTQGFHQPNYGEVVAVNDPALANWSIEIFPNPTADVLHVRFSADQSGPLRASVFDLLGRPVITDQPLINSDDSPIDCTDWQAGVYLLLLQDPATHASATVRFIRL